MVADDFSGPDSSASILRDLVLAPMRSCILDIISIMVRWLFIIMVVLASSAATFMLMALNDSLMAQIAVDIPPSLPNPSFRHPTLALDP